jgi:iron complex transport system substrate-binding protein
VKPPDLSGSAWEHGISIAIPDDPRTGESSAVFRGITPPSASSAPPRKIVWIRASARSSFVKKETVVHELDDITGAIVDSAMRIHRDLGPGLLESVYEAVLARTLEKRGYQVACQEPICFEYEGMAFKNGFRVDLLVEGRVIVELKSIEKLAPVHSKQLLTYLRLLHLPVGLLINFGHVTLREGLHRVVNQLPPSASPRLRVNQAGDLSTLT